jgi:hypothetical protein
LILAERNGHSEIVELILASVQARGFSRALA